MSVFNKFCKRLCILMCLSMIMVQTTAYAAVERPQQLQHTVPDGLSKISTFTVPYPKSSSSATNVSLGILHLDGTYLLPDESFSFSDCLGARVSENGYKAGAAFNGSGGSVLSYGGGICRVASGLYNAIIRAGIVPTERKAHSGKVNYPGIPLGLDAAIASGYKDLRFTNHFDHPIYIEAYSGDDPDNNRYSFVINLYSDPSVLNDNSYVPYSFPVGPNTYDSYLYIMHGDESVGDIYLGRSTYF